MIKKIGIGFEVQYESEQQIGNFTASFKDNDKVNVSAKELRSMAGQNLGDFIPDAIKKSLYLESFSFSISKETKKIEDCQLKFNSFRNWELLESSNLSLEQIKVIFGILKPTEKAKREFRGRLTGFTDINGKPVQLGADLNKDKESLQLIGSTQGLRLDTSIKALVGKDAIKGIDMPENLIALQLDASTLSFAPYQKRVSMAAETNFGLLDLWVQREKVKKENKTNYLAIIQPPKDFKPSQLNKNFASLDNFGLGDKKIVISRCLKRKKLVV